MITLDHLVVAAPDLESGADYVESVLGVRPSGGGSHEFMGTHNRLLRLGQAYLEVIAVDPRAPKPPRARWFGLDDFTGQPRLIHWVARTDQLERAVRDSLEPLGVVTPAARGDLRWRITIPEDGHLPAGGLLPTLIQWDGPHPISRLPESGCALLRLELFHPEPEGLRRALKSLKLEYPVSFAARPGLRASLSSPKGAATLE